MNSKLLYCLGVCLCLLLASCSNATTTDPNTKVIESTEKTIAAVASVHPGGELPDHFMNGDTVRREGDFDANSYFTVLTHLSLEPGYTLDYVYYATDLGGNPVVYARPVDQAPYASYDDYMASVDQTSSDYRDEYLNHVKIDDTPEGYFQFAILDLLGGDFYLFWHGQYNNTTIVYDRDSLKRAFSAVETYVGSSGIPDEVRDAAEKVDLRPTVKLLDDGTATVRIVTFSMFSGLTEVRYTMKREFPHTMTWDAETLVEYDSGVAF